MTSPPNPPSLTPEQQGRILGILSVGCDRETAANYIGCTLEEFVQAMQNDAAFADSVLRTEAGAELAHMRNIQKVAEDKKDWRASVWWLEQRAPERFGRRAPGTVTTRQLKIFLQQLGDGLVADIRSDEDRGRVVARLHRNHKVIDLLFDDLVNAQAVLGPSVPLLEYFPEPAAASEPADASATSEASETSSNLDL